MTSRSWPGFGQSAREVFWDGAAYSSMAFQLCLEDSAAHSAAAPACANPAYTTPEPARATARFQAMSEKSKSKPRVPHGRRGAKPHDENENQATVEEFDREGLGVVPKE